MPKSIVNEIASDKKLLVYSKCGGFIHESISTGEEMFKAIEKKYPRLIFTFESDAPVCAASRISSIERLFICPTFDISWVIIRDR